MLNFNVPLTVTRMSASGELQNMVRAIIWPGYIAVPVDADVEVGDKLERRLPNGKTSVVYVSEVNVLESPFGNAQDHTEVKYTTTPSMHQATAVMSSLESVTPQIFRKTDLRRLADALANGVTQKEIDKFELGLETNTRGQSKDSRAAIIVEHIFNGDDPDEGFLNLLDFIYLESERARYALEGEAYLRLKKVLDIRGVLLTDDGFRISSTPASEFHPREIESTPNIEPPHPTPSLTPVSGVGVRLTDSLDISLENEPQGAPEIEATMYEPANRKVFIVRGRDQRPVDSLETFLHFAGLEVLSWNEAENLTGDATPDTYDVINEAMKAAAVIIVVFSPDDEAKLKDEFLAEGITENLEGQPRQNVLLEAGMAFAMARERTIFVQSDRTRPISDIAGFNWVTMDGAWENREKLIERLKRAGALVKLANPNLQSHLAGPFKVT